MRHRSWFFLVLTVIALGASLYTDPDKGLSTLLGGLAIGQGIWAVVAAHYTHRALFDYPEARRRSLFIRAAMDPVGAGLALVALAIVFVGLLLVFSPRAHAESLPAGFATYGPILKAEQRMHWADHPDPALLAALIEQESCPSLKSPKCWNPGARLKSAREEGAGMGQLTRAYRADGTQRLDALADLRRQYGAELSGLSWDSVYRRPDLQLRAVVLKSRDTSLQFRNSRDWLEFGDAAYNGGVAGLQMERRACKLAAGCDPDRWFGHVERHCLKSRQPLYAGRSACDINREHPRNVFKVRRAKYVQAMNTL